MAHIVILWAFFLTFSRVIVGLWALGFMITVCAFKFSSGRGPSGETDGTGFPGLGKSMGFQFNERTLTPAFPE